VSEPVTLFEPATARRLAWTLRAFAALFLLRIVLGPYPALADQPAALFRPVSFLRWLGLSAMPGRAVIVAVQALGAVGAVGALAGGAVVTRRVGRVGLVVGWLALLFLAGLRTSTGKLLHNDTLLLIGAFPLLFAPMPPSEDDDGRPSPSFGWPLSLGLAAVCLVYFFTGVAKLRHSGLSWVTGDNMRYVLLAASRSGLPHFPAIARFMGRSALLSHLSAAGILGLELAFPIAYLVPRTRRYFALGAVALHVGTWLALGLDYWLWAATAALLLVDVSALTTRAPRPGPATAPRPPRGEPAPRPGRG
jgi:hypothetical protein